MEFRSVAAVVRETGISRRTLQVWRAIGRGQVAATAAPPTPVKDYGYLWGEAQCLALEIAREIMQRLRLDPDASRQAENLRVILGGAHLGAQHHMNYTLGRGTQAQPGGNVVVPIQIIVRADSNV